MTSTMAATNCARLDILRSLSKEDHNTCRRYSKNVNIKFKRRRFWTMASGGSQKNKINMDVINGRKVNGVVNFGDVSQPLKDVNYVDTPLNAYLLGKFAEDRFVYRQTFIIRSYETGPDKTATMETLMNLLQETALNHVSSSGLAGNGFGATREMSLRKLIWVVTRVHIQVERYSFWGDVIEIDTWVNAEGKNGMRRDWVIRDYNTREIITKATSTWVIMNRETRRLSKIPEQVRQEVSPFYLQRSAIVAGKSDSERIEKLTHETAQRIKTGLAPRWSDMDANQHVNNVKYIGWILESVPMNVLEKYDLGSMTLEYRRECRQSNLLESMTSPTPNYSEDSSNTTTTTPKFTHMLRLQSDKAEIVRARTQWHSKSKSTLIT